MHEIYNEDDITVDMLGFYSLLMSYVNVAINTGADGECSLLYLHTLDESGHFMSDTDRPPFHLLTSCSY